MEIIDLGENVRIIITEHGALLQKSKMMKFFSKNTFIYFFLSGLLLISLIYLISGFSSEVAIASFFAVFLVFGGYLQKHQIEELEINLNDSFIKHRYNILGRIFKNKTLFSNLNDVRFILLPGTTGNEDETFDTFELVGKMSHFKHIDLFLFYHKENALKLIPIFRDKLGIEIIDDLNNFSYLK